jgi:hypothetical protein
VRLDSAIEKLKKGNILDKDLIDNWYEVYFCRWILGRLFVLEKIWQEKASENKWITKRYFYKPFW